MKSTMSLTVLGTIMALSGSAIALPPPVPAPRTAREPAPTSLARMEFKKTTHDVGQVFDHESQEFKFEFTNTGEEDLIIERVQSSCGCTASELEKKVYAPGESGAIDVVFNPKGKKGDQRRQLTVYSNANGREAVLLVTGSVTQLVAIDPGILSMGSVAKGQSATKFITVTGRTEDFEVTRATAGNLEVFATRVVGVEPIAELDANGSETGVTLRRATIEVTLKEGAKVGRVDDRLTIRTNDARRPIVTAQVIATVMGDLAVTPPRISIGRPELGETFEREFTIASRSGEAFEIKEIRYPNGPVRIEFEHSPVNADKPDTYKIRMKATAARVHPRLRQEIVIRTNVEGEEEIRVPISGVISTRQ